MMYEDQNRAADLKRSEITGCARALVKCYEADRDCDGIVRDLKRFLTELDRIQDSNE